MNLNKNWYEDYKQEVEKMQKEKCCPVCGRDYITHYGEVGYIFICNNCGATFEFTGKYSKTFQNY